jgi:antitoxin MazE
METKVQKWGNTLAVRIPKAFAQSAGLQEGGAIAMELVGQQVVLTPLRPVVISDRIRQYMVPLSELMAGMGPENMHPATEWGPPVGREIVEPYEGIAEHRA